MSDPTSHATDPDETETLLPGGDVTVGVVRVGATVRRPTNPNSPYVHALLRHLEAVGFDGAPRFLGLDAQGRETLTFVDGEVAGRPRPDWIADEDRLVSLARLVRRYDDATSSFVPPDDVRPDRGIADSPGTPPEPAGEPEIAGHLDITPENVVFRDGRAVALIDFDLAGPATRADELVNLLLWWAPLFDPADRDPLLRDVDVERRVRLALDAYGASDADRERVVDVALARTARAWFLMRHRAETLGGGWARMWDEGVGDVILRRRTWLEENGDALRAACAR
ncbi:phosphotransferase [Luteimicrobium sp. NPDC057192]|uniref:phosphotransferase n=1 Tax=Luteimicrobium sp. NPDC057192 TaxID=3346042 RepID=UPI00363DED9D